LLAAPAADSASAHATPIRSFDALNRDRPWLKRPVDGSGHSQAAEYVISQVRKPILASRCDHSPIHFFNSCPTNGLRFARLVPQAMVSVPGEIIGSEAPGFGLAGMQPPFVGRIRPTEKTQVLDFRASPLHFVG
jgi:hypothetical protein